MAALSRTDEDLAPAVSDGEARPLRADARRNRERIVEAAHAAFTADGPDVQMEEIARRAGVGVGTLYRHFPTKQAIIAEISRQFLTSRVAIVERALALGDPSLAIVSLVRESARALHQDLGLRAVFEPLGATEGCPGIQEELRTRLDDLMARARETHAIRSDVDTPAMQALLCGLAASIGAGAPWGVAADVLLAGLRAEPCFPEANA